MQSDNISILVPLGESVMRYDLRGHELLVETLKKMSKGALYKFAYYKDVLHEEISILSYSTPRYLYEIGTQIANGLAKFEYIDDFDTFSTKEELIKELEAGYELVKRYSEEIPLRVSQKDIVNLPFKIKDHTENLKRNVQELLKTCLVFADMIQELRGDEFKKLTPEKNTKVFANVC